MWFGIALIVVIALGVFLVWNGLASLGKKLDRPAAPPKKTCASCGQELVGDYPVRVDDVVSALVGQPPVKVTFYVCQRCIGYEVTP
jgi:hypothetical protein